MKPTTPENIAVPSGGYPLSSRPFYFINFHMDIVQQERFSEVHKVSSICIPQFSVVERLKSEERQHLPGQPPSKSDF